MSTQIISHVKYDIQTSDNGTTWVKHNEFSYAALDHAQRAAAELRTQEAGESVRVVEVRETWTVVPDPEQAAGVDAATQALLDQRDNDGSTIMCNVAANPDKGLPVLYDPRHDGDPLPWVITFGTRRYSSADCIAHVSEIDVQDEEDDGNECEGHESPNGADMGQTTYCDGSCRPR